MSSKTHRRISIIIPAYNEEKCLRKCLDSIRDLHVKPYEVIVVDNNSTDSTAIIAAEYPFVTVIHEKKQGLIAARNTGFDAASGDILGRLNADVVLEKNWTKVLLDLCSADDVWGVSGPAKTHTLPLTNKASSIFWSWWYFILAKSDIGIDVLWGANMAITRQAWHAIKQEVCLNDKKVHEDQDISLLINSHGHRTVVSALLRVATDEQSYAYLPKFIEYSLRRRQTTRYHRHRGTYNTITPYSTLKTFGLRAACFMPYTIFIAVITIGFPFVYLYSCAVNRLGRK